MISKHEYIHLSRIVFDSRIVVSNKNVQDVTDATADVWDVSFLATDADAEFLKIRPSRDFRFVTSWMPVP